MQDHTETLIDSQFAKDIRLGLTDFPKHLSSKYFYDKKGDQLFQDIMNMPEYYLTNAEFDILKKHKRAIINLFALRGKFKLIELGAGDGTKTKILLRHLVETGIDFKYQPIDISQNALHQLEKSIHNEIPDARVEPLLGSYFEVLERVNIENGMSKVILFLGSNIGNLLHDHAIDFLRHVCDFMNDDDLFFVGFDQKKNPQTILDAYNDPSGITAAFNKNILTRINTEFDANFNIDQFKHWEVYNPETGAAKSYLVSTVGQIVNIKALDLIIDFKPWETIHTEISQKYDDETVLWLAKKSGLRSVARFGDTENQFKNYAFKKNKSKKVRHSL